MCVGGCASYAYFCVNSDGCVNNDNSSRVFVCVCTCNTVAINHISTVCIRAV
jgi:hypothetical protein